MTRTEYMLEITAKEELHHSIGKILGKVATGSSHESWFYSIVETQDEFFDFINNFLDLLEGKYAKLSELGISKNDIIIWYFYVHDGQCNLNFDPQRMRRLGENGITLCISCYQKEKE